MVMLLLRAYECEMIPFWMENVRMNFDLSPGYEDFGLTGGVVLWPAVHRHQGLHHLAQAAQEGQSSSTLCPPMSHLNFMHACRLCNLP